MTRQFLRIGLAFAICGTLATTSAAQQPNPNPNPNPNSNQNQNRVSINANRVTVALTDPARPPSMRVKLLQGRIAIKGTNRKRIRERLQAALAARPDLQKRIVVDVDPLSVL